MGQRVLHLGHGVLSRRFVNVLPPSSLPSPLGTENRYKAHHFGHKLGVDALRDRPQRDRSAFLAAMADFDLRPPVCARFGFWDVLPISMDQRRAIN